MIFDWRTTDTGGVVSTCRHCGQVVSRSRHREAVFRAQRTHAKNCTPAAPAGPLALLHTRR